MRKITLYFLFLLIPFFSLCINGKVYANKISEGIANNSLWDSKSYSPELYLQPYFNFFETNNNFFFFFEEDSNLIYSEDFEGDHDWTFVNDATNKWYVGEAVNNGAGTKALYISNDNGVSYAYTIAGTQVSHAYKDIDIPEGTNDISIDFDWKCMGETTSFDRFRIWIVPNTFVPVAGTEILASVENIQIGRTNYNGNNSFLRENLIVDATPYAGTSVRVVFEWRNDAGVGTQPPAAIDNIEVSVITCSIPTTLVLNRVTYNSLIVDWTAPSEGASGYELFYSENDTSPAADTIPSISSISVTSQEVTGLEPSTEYFVWVRSVCDDDDKSKWVGPLTVQTACGVITAIPFVETFSTTSPTKSCWTVIDGNDDGKTWDLNYSSNMFVGDRVAVINTDLRAGNNDDWLISPTIVLTGNQRLKYHYRVHSASEPNDFRVMLSTSGPLPENFTEEIVPLAAYDNVSYIENIVNLLDENGNAYTGEVNIAWHIPRGGLDGWRLYVDNVIIEDIPSCPDPSNILLSNVSESEAKIDWTTGFNETQWEISVQLEGTGIPTTNGTSTTANSYTISTLDYSTQYEVYVRAVCGEDDKSNWVGPVSFITTQIPVQLPYTDDFEGDVGFSFNNSTTNAWVVGTAVHNGQGEKSMYVSKDNGVSYEYNITSSSVSHAYRDIAIPANTQEISISFDWKNMGESTYDRFRVWLVPVSFNPEAGTQITTSGTERVQVGRTNYSLNNEFLNENIVADVSVFAGQNVRLVFEWHNDTSGGTQPPAAIDNLSVEVIACSAPINISIDGVTENSIGISWTAPLNAGNGTSYDFFFATTNETPNEDSVSTHTSTDTNFTFDNLNTNTEYYIWIRTNCNEDGTTFWIGPLNVRTLQIPAELPYTENFEGDVVFSFDNSTTNAWVVGTAVHNGQGEKSMYVSRDNGVSYEYNITSSSVSHAYRDIAIPANTQEISISFDWQNMGESSFDRFRVWLVPVSFNPEAGTQITTSEAERVQVGRTNYSLNNEFLDEIIVADVSVFAGQNVRLVFEWRNDTSGGTQPPAAIDNLNVAVITCSAPTNISVGEVTENSIGVSWTAPLNAGNGTSYDLFFGTTNEIPNEDSVPSHTSTDTNFTFDNLTSNTTYFIWVRSNCNADGTSFWIGPLAVRTFQVPAELPYTENFETEAEFSFNNSTTNAWVLGTAVHNGQGEKAMYISKDDGVSYEYQITRASVSHAYRDLVIPANTQEISISYDWRCMGESIHDRFRVWLVPVSFNPEVGSEITESGTERVQVGRINYSVNNRFLHESIEVDVSAFAGQTVRLVFEWRNDTSGGNQPPAAIDNLEVKVVTCKAPSVLEVNSITTNSVGLAWSHPEGATSGNYEYYYSQEVEISPTNDTEPMNANLISGTSIIINDLQPATSYYIWVRKNCGDQDGNSIWIGPIQVTTDCTFFGSPFWEGFNADSMTELCWSVNGENTGIRTWNMNWTFDSFEGNQVAYIRTSDDFTTLNNEYLISPQFNLTGNQILRFHYKVLGRSFFKVLASTTGTNPEDFTIEILPQQTYTNTLYQEVTLDLNLSNGSGISGLTYIAFVVEGEGIGSNSGLYIDNFHIIDKSLCTPSDISNIGFCPTSSSGTQIFWDPAGSENTWELIIKDNSRAPEENDEIIVLNEPSYKFENTVLNHTYAAWLRVVCPQGKGEWFRREFIPRESNITDANPFCADDRGIIFPNVHGPRNNTYGKVACLSSTPNAVWYFLRVDEPGDLIFEIIQRTEFDENGDPAGRGLDVDYVAFGPFNDLAQACQESNLGPCPEDMNCVNNTSTASSYPQGNIVDCSYSGAAIETLTILDAQPGQRYAVLITNYDGAAGFIKLRQTNLGEPEAGTTDCKFLCEIDLGEDIVGCEGSDVELKGHLSTNVAVEDMGATFQWYKDDVLLDETVYNTQSIRVTEPGIYKVVLMSRFCEEPAESTIAVSFKSVFEGTVKSKIEVCDFDNDGKGEYNLNEFASEILSTSSESENNKVAIYSTFEGANQAAEEELIALTDSYVSEPKLIYVRIDRTDMECFGIYEVELFITETIYPIIDFDYNSPICINNLDLLEPNFSDGFMLGGEFSYEGLKGGLDINMRTGIIDVANSQAGSYVITYSYSIPSGKCGEDKSSSYGIEIFDRFQISYMGDCVSNKFQMRPIDMLQNIDMDQATFVWTSPNGFNSTDREVFVSEKGVYNLLLTTNDGCYEELEIDLTDVNCAIQKGISPNGDGYNDYFDLTQYQVLKLSIFNRYGKKVYSKTLYSNEWEGQDNSGNKLPDGTYFYEFKTPNEIYSGWIQINK